MASEKFLIGGFFALAAMASSIPLLFTDYNRFAHSVTKIERSNTTASAASILESSKDLGYYDKKLLTVDELLPLERQMLFDADKQKYKAIENILAKRYLHDVLEKYMEEKKISDPNVAQGMFISEHVKVTENQIKEFISKNAENPRLKGKTLEEQDSIVRPFIEQQEISLFFRRLVEDAINEGKIEITGVSMPAEPRAIIPTEGSPSIGANPAPITLIEFADFQCPFCASAQNTVFELMKKYEGKIRFVFKQFPLVQIHPKAMDAAIVSLCAEKQGKYWRVHEALFANSQNLEEATFLKIAEGAGLDSAAFASCRKDPLIQKQVKADMDVGSSLGINATPVFFINGIKLVGVQPLFELEKIVKRELAAATNH